MIIKDEPQNLCIHDEQNKTSQAVAQALLSLGNTPHPAPQHQAHPEAPGVPHQEVPHQAGRRHNWRRHPGRQRRVRPHRDGSAEFRWSQADQI